jgi:hypothetical protein
MRIECISRNGIYHQHAEERVLIPGISKQGVDVLLEGTAAW